MAQDIVPCPRFPFPAGLAIEIWRGAWPPATLWMCVTNDFIWWIPFGLYLRDAWPHARDGGRAAP